MLSGVYSSGISINGLLAAAGGHGVKGARSVRGGEPAESSEKVGAPKAVGKTELTDEEKQQIEKLKQRDAEVRRHEQAHKAAAGGHAAGGPTFDYQTGPDGKQYAVGGEVQIDTSAVPNNPQATIAKMQQIRRAASAPAEPSSQDRKVAAQAAQAEQQARRELAEQRAEKNESGESGSIEPKSAGAAELNRESTTTATTASTNAEPETLAASENAAANQSARSFIATDPDRPRPGLAKTLGSQTVTPSTATISRVLVSPTRGSNPFDSTQSPTGQYIDAHA